MFSEKTRIHLRMLRFGASMLRSGPRSRRTVADLVERRAAAHPDRCFVTFEGRKLSYGNEFRFGWV